MPILDNPKHERFAQLVATGVSLTEAAKVAGYSEVRAASTGSDLAKNRKIAERISELTVRVADQTVSAAAIDRAWVLKRLIENTERAMQVEPVLDREGKETGEYVYAGNVANKALELIGKELGMFIDRKEVKSEQSVTVDLSKLTDEELARLQEIAKKVQGE